MGLTIDLVLGLGFFPAVRFVLCDCLHAGVASTASSSAANIQERARFSRESVRLHASACFGDFLIRQTC